MDAMIIYQNPLHFEIRLFTVLLIVKLNECILQAIASPLVSNNFTRYYLSKSRENEVKVFICILQLVMPSTQKGRAHSPNLLLRDSACKQRVHSLGV